MAGQKFSPDVLAANPNLAATIKAAGKPKQDRSRKSGHRGALNAQDFPPVHYTPTQEGHILRGAAANFAEMVRVWGNGRDAETVAQDAALALVAVLDKELSCLD